MQAESKFFQIFIYKGFQIRTVEYKGETWWVASDICKVLEIANSRQAINGNEKAGDPGLDDDEKGVLNLYTPGGPQATLCVNEPGLYHLISKSRTPEAKAFGRWIRHEVLPAIRKTGHYSLAQEEPQAQPSQWLNWDTALIATLSQNEHMRLIRYERARLSFLESAYDFKYPQSYNNKYPEEEPGPHSIETLVLPPVETKPDLQTMLLEYLRKTGSVTVRYIQQSGPRSLRNLPAEQLRAMLQTLVANGVAKVVKVGKTESYQMQTPGGSYAPSNE
jgi:prophage antirepressor-like protein